MFRSRWFSKWLRQDNFSTFWCLNIYSIPLNAGDVFCSIIHFEWNSCAQYRRLDESSFVWACSQCVYRDKIPACRQVSIILIHLWGVACGILCWCHRFQTIFVHSQHCPAPSSIFSADAAIAAFVWRVCVFAFESCLSKKGEKSWFHELGHQCSKQR